MESCAAVIFIFPKAFVYLQEGQAAKENLVESTSDRNHACTIQDFCTRMKTNKGLLKIFTIRIGGVHLSFFHLGLQNDWLKFM